MKFIWQYLSKLQIHTLFDPDSQPPKNLANSHSSIYLKWRTKERDPMQCCLQWQKAGYDTNIYRMGTGKPERKIMQSYKRMGSLSVLIRNSPVTSQVKKSRGKTCVWAASISSTKE